MMQTNCEENVLNELKAIRSQILSLFSIASSLCTTVNNTIQELQSRKTVKKQSHPIEKPVALGPQESAKRKSDKITKSPALAQHPGDNTVTKRQAELLDKDPSCPDAVWKCCLCDQQMTTRQRSSHLLSKKHKKRQKLEHLFFYNEMTPAKLRKLKEQRKKTCNTISKNRISAYIDQKALCFCCNRLMWEPSLGYEMLRKYFLKGQRTCDQKKIDQYQSTAEHVRPKSVGGQNTSANIVATCKRCNTLRAEKIGFPVVPFVCNPVPRAFNLKDNEGAVTEKPQRQHFVNDIDYKMHLYSKLSCQRQSVCI